MKYFFSNLLLFLILQKILTISSLKMKTAKAANKMKFISNSKEKKLRKLAGTDEPDEDYGTPGNATSPTEIIIIKNKTSPTYENTPAESGNATAENTNVPVSKPLFTKAKSTGNKKASVQISKFYGFKAPITSGSGKVKFGTYFYFFERPIVKFIIMRLRIIYNKKLRNLDYTEISESARTN